MGKQTIEVSETELRRLLKRFLRKVFVMGFCMGIITGMCLWHAYLLFIGWSAQ